MTGRAFFCALRDDAAMAGTPGEFDLIEKIRANALADARIVLGIGDDAAILRTAGEADLLVAADMLLEGRHFDVAMATPRLIGRKSLAVNLSDIAAMAGRPVAGFVTVAHRREFGYAFAEELHAGIAALAAEFNVVIAGGDTNVWDGPLVVSVTLLGEVAGGRAVSRGGAQVGDRVLVTGPLGGSLPSGRHLSFPPRVAEALALHAALDLHAMIDVSDGLLADVGHICRESGVGAILRSEAIPIAEAARASRDRRSPLEHALTDGEDFELAICLSPPDAERLRRNPLHGVTVYDVGEIIAEAGVKVHDESGREITFPSSGWVHRW